MSRTFRRPNYEYINRKYVGGSKIAGYYTGFDFVYHDGVSHNSQIVYRLPTERELYRDFREAHLDGVFNRWGILKEDRKFSEAKHRQQEKQKVIRFLKGQSNDVIADRLLKRQPWHWIW